MQRLYWAVTMAALVFALPIAAQADDQELADQIAYNMKSSGRLKDYKVAVKVQDGTAWLKGTVANEEQMTIALMIAEESYGVDRVVNHLTIGSARQAARPMGAGYAGGGLRQPASVAQHGPARHDVVQTSLELPDHAQQELAVGGPMHPGVAPAATEPEPYTAGPRAAQPMAPAAARRPMPLPIGARGPYQQVSQNVPGETIGTPRPMPMHASPVGMPAPAPMQYDSPSMPNYAWPSYAAYPNYAALTYPKQYSPTAWPYIGPFYPYPQVPLGWRKVTMEWKDGWWFLDFKDSPH